jgi:hypothetical protein
MILSLHIPKTGGVSFRLWLETFYGARMLADYGDWPGFNTPEMNARRLARMAAMRARRDELLRDFEIIHGHFLLEKYVGLFPSSDVVAFFRDPYQQAVSQYEFLTRQSDGDNLVVRRFHELRPTLPEFIALMPNPQSLYLSGSAVEDLAMVGLTEQYERGVALFVAVFGCKLPPETERRNVNPNRRGETYEINREVRTAVNFHSEADIELYRRARERFARLCARFDI